MVVIEGMIIVTVIIVVHITFTLKKKRKITFTYKKKIMKIIIPRRNFKI